MRERREQGSDDGFSLIEVMVSMAIMSMFAAVFTGGMISTFTVIKNSEAETEAQSQVSNYFLSLDSEVRYAYGLSLPAVSQGYWYTEYLIQNGNTVTCVELRVPSTGGSLQRRSWPQGGTPPVFTTRITNVGLVIESGIGVAPFIRTTPDTRQSYQQLQVRLQGNAAKGAGVNGSLDITLTAMNTMGVTSSDTLCTEGRGVNA